MSDHVQLSGEAREQATLRSVLGMIGLARRARRLVMGTEAVLKAVSGEKKPAIVLAASDISDRTKKQLTDKCSYHRVKLTILPADRAALAAATGNKDSQCSACAVTDGEMAKKIDFLINS